MSAPAWAASDAWPTSCMAIRATGCVTDTSEIGAGQLREQVSPASSNNLDFGNRRILAVRRGT